MGIFGKRRTVETIIAPITRIVEQLNEHAEEHHDKANHHLNLSGIHAAHSDDARKEASKAHATASKVAGLVS